MHQGYRIIAVTPAGRRRYLKLLLPHLIAQRPLIDEWHLWMNCFAESNGGENWEDVQFCQQIRDEQPDFIKLIPRKPRVPNPNPHRSRSLTIHKFFEHCTDRDTIYIRFDDDIIWIAPDAVRELIDYRIKNPRYFLVFANIINNAITSHLHQQLGTLDQSQGAAGHDCYDRVGWRNARFAEHVHRQFLTAIHDGATDRYRFPERILQGPNGPQRFSINCFAFFGKQFARFNGQVGADEEYWLTVAYPAEQQLLNAICGNSLVAHYAFYTQRAHLDQTDTLEQYARLSPNPSSNPSAMTREIRPSHEPSHRHRAGLGV